MKVGTLEARILSLHSSIDSQHSFVFSLGSHLLSADCIYAIFIGDKAENETGTACFCLIAESFLDTFSFLKSSLHSLSVLSVLQGQPENLMGIFKICFSNCFLPLDAK